MGDKGLEHIDLEIGRRLAERRALLGLCHEEVALACGFDTEQVARWEAGVEPLLAAQLYVLAEVLEVPLNYFYNPQSPGG